MDAETMEKIGKITERLIAVRQSIKPIQRRVQWFKRKIEREPDNFYLKAELDALSLCWKLLREERLRLKIFESYLNNQLEGESDVRTTDTGTTEDEGAEATGSDETRH